MKKRTHWCFLDFPDPETDFDQLGVSKKAWEAVKLILWCVGFLILFGIGAWIGSHF